MALIDLSHTIEHGMITHPGIPGPQICDFLSRESSRGRYAPGVEFQIGRIDLVANTGTYVDAPFHRYAHGRDLAALPLDSLANLDAVVVRIPESVRAIGPEFFHGLSLTGRAVLVHTGFSRHWRTPAYLEKNPFLTAEASMLLRDAGARLVGIDSVNIDDLGDPARPAHTLLLGADIPLAEHLTGLHLLPDGPLRFFAVPPRVSAFGTFPVRAFAIAP